MEPMIVLAAVIAIVGGRYLRNTPLMILGWFMLLSTGIDVYKNGIPILTSYVSEEISNTTVLYNYTYSDPHFTEHSYLGFVMMAAATFGLLGNIYGITREE